MTTTATTDRPDRRALVLLGAGSAVFTRGLIADLIEAPDLGTWELRLVDPNDEALDGAARLGEAMVATTDIDVVITTASHHTEVLKGADVVVSTVGVGGRSAWERDFEIPRKFGIYQPVADSIMPGGVSRTLRTVPVMVEIARDVARLCPDAHFLNFSNPMTANITAMHRYTDAKPFGLCHGVWDVQKMLAEFIGADPERTSSLFVGLNHLTWIYDFRVDGQDAWPLVRERLAREGRQPRGPEDVGQIWQTSTHAGTNPFSWELFETYGAYPAANDRHVTEFFPERFRGPDNYHGKTLGVDAFSAEEILAWGEERYQGMLRQAREGELDQSLFEASQGEQEQLPLILRALMYDTKDVFSVNIPHDGAVSGVRDNAVLELPAAAGARGFHALKLSDVPAGLLAIIQRKLAGIEMTVEAAMEADHAKVVEALLLDGAVADPSTAAELADALLAAQDEHLPNW